MEVCARRSPISWSRSGKELSKSVLAGNSRHPGSSNKRSRSAEAPPPDPSAPRLVLRRRALHKPRRTHRRDRGRSAGRRNTRHRPQTTTIPSVRYETHGASHRHATWLGPQVRSARNRGLRNDENWRGREQAPDLPDREHKRPDLRGADKPQPRALGHGCIALEGNKAGQAVLRALIAVARPVDVGEADLAPPQRRKAQLPTAQYKVMSARRFSK
jgi:hypothetical protein